jgi:hypothetical protein
LQRSCCRCTQSVLPRPSTVSCVILKRLGVNDAAPSSSISLPARNPAPRLAPHKTHHPPLPRAQLPQPRASNIVRAQPAIVSTRSQRSCRRCAAYHGGPAMSAVSSLRDSVPATLPQYLRSDCLHATQPFGSPLASPATRSSSARIRPSPQHATSCMQSRRSQASAHSAAHADACSVQLRSSDVSCVILPRLGVRLRHSVMYRARRATN